MKSSKSLNADNIVTRLGDPLSRARHYHGNRSEWLVSSLVDLGWRCEQPLWVGVYRPAKFGQERLRELLNL
jgi:hypothetical protein